MYYVALETTDWVAGALIEALIEANRARRLISEQLIAALRDCFDPEAPEIWTAEYEDFVGEDRLEWSWDIARSIRNGADYGWVRVPAVRLPTQMLHDLLVATVADIRATLDLATPAQWQAVYRPGLTLLYDPVEPAPWTRGVRRMGENALGDQVVRLVVENRFVYAVIDRWPERAMSFDLALMEGRPALLVYEEARPAHSYPLRGHSEVKPGHVPSRS